MRAVRIMMKIIVFPILLLVCLLKWAWLFLSGCSQILFFLVAFVLFLTAVGSYVFRLEDGTGTMQILLGGFAMFMIPVVASGILAVLILIQELLTEFIFG